MSIFGVGGSEPVRGVPPPGSGIPGEGGKEISAKDMVERRGNSAYIDMGVLYGHIQSNFMVWWPEPVSIDQAKLDDFLNDLFSQLGRDGIKKIEFSFAQISDIEKLVNGQGGGSAADKITDIFKDNFKVGKTSGQNFLKYFISAAHHNGVRAELSFGGAIASASDWKINGNPATAAQHLVEFMNNYDIDGADFDIESDAIMKGNSASDVQTFFKTLHQGLSPAKDVTLTVMGDINQWSKTLAPLFTGFDSMFDGLNLMLYSDKEFYIDADNPTWGLKQWISLINDPSKIHIGFFDSIPYENPDASSGKKYDVSGLERGEAAAKIYLDVLKDLGLSKAQMGEPFWWTDNPTTISGNKTMEQFYNYLSKH
jgi:hypothetical protein